MCKTYEKVNYYFAEKTANNSTFGSYTRKTKFGSIGNVDDGMVEHGQEPTEHERLVFVLPWSKIGVHGKNILIQDVRKISPSVR